MTTPEEYAREIEHGRKSLIRDLRTELGRDLDQHPIDTQMLREIVEVLEASRAVGLACTCTVTPTLRTLDRKCPVHWSPIPKATEGKS